MVEWVKTEGREEEGWFDAVDTLNTLSFNRDYGRGFAIINGNDFSLTVHIADEKKLERFAKVSDFGEAVTLFKKCKEEKEEKGEKKND